MQKVIGTLRAACPPGQGIPRGPVQPVLPKFNFEIL
jgi:hypothetical protein